MNKHNKFKRHVLISAQACSDYLGVKPIVESARWTIEERIVCQILFETMREGLLVLATFDGRLECDLHEWLQRGNSLESFFHNAADSGYVRVRLTLAGVEMAEALSKNLIGFAAHKYV
jgi:hypothetical protein